MEYPFSSQGKESSYWASPRAQMEGMPMPSKDSNYWASPRAKAKMEGIPMPSRDNNYWVSPRTQMEGMPIPPLDGVARYSGFEDLFNNSAELMNLDMYDGWCSNPLLADQMFAGSLSPLYSMSSSYPPLDALNLPEQSSVGFVNSEENDSRSCLSGADRTVYQHTNTQARFPLGFVNGNNSTPKRASFQHNNNISDTGYGLVIPRSLEPPLAEKMLKALSLFKESAGEGILAQFWVPMNDGDRYLLTTCDQPYLLDQMLAGYREVSREFTFSAEVKEGSFPGLPGRVFMSKIPEWTSNVVYYNKAEYLRVQHAVSHEVRGSIALPIFGGDPLERSCCAVLELVTIKEKPNFDAEIDGVCHALQVIPPFNMFI